MNDTNHNTLKQMKVRILDHTHRKRNGEMKPFEIYADEEEEEDDTPKAPRNLDAGFVVYDDNADESSGPEDADEVDRRLWNLLEASNERLSPEAQVRLSGTATPKRRASPPPADIVTPIKALSFEQTDSIDPFSPFETPSSSFSRQQQQQQQPRAQGTPIRVRPAAFPRTRLQLDPARDTVIVRTPRRDPGVPGGVSTDRQSVIMQIPGAAAIDNTRNLVNVLSAATLMTHVLDKDGQTDVIVSERIPVVKNHGKKGVSCKFMRIAPVSRVENADAIKPNVFDPVNVDAPEHLGVFTVVPAYFRGSRRREGDVVTIEPCNLMYSLAGSDVTVIQPGTVEHVSTVNHVIMTLMSSNGVTGRRGPQTILKLAIHKRVWAHGMERLTDTLHFVNIPFRGMTGETFDCSVSTKIVAASSTTTTTTTTGGGGGGAAGGRPNARRPSLAYVFITGVKFNFPPSVRTLSVEQYQIAREPQDKTPKVRLRKLFADDQ